MSKKLTFEEAVFKAKSVWGDRFTYLGTYTGYDDKTFEVVCPKHGKFTTSLANHLERDSAGCPWCQEEYIISEERRSPENFIQELEQKYKGQEISYESTNYTTAWKPVELICKKHGKFSCIPHNLLDKERQFACPDCSQEEKARKRVEKYAASFRDRLLTKSEGKLILLGEYKGAKEKTWFECTCCGYRFENTPNHQLNPKRGGCPECNKKAGQDAQRLTIEEIYQKSEKIFGTGQFIYTNYISYSENLDITCTSCGNTFPRLLSNHFKSNGCPFCGEKYHLEKNIQELLGVSAIQFVRQKTFDWLINGSCNKLRLDFYLPEYNVAIECQGLQHFQSVDYFGGEENFKIRLENDKLKLDLCTEHGIKIIYYSNLGIDYPYEVFEDLDEILKIIKNYV